MGKKKENSAIRTGQSERDRAREKTTHTQIDRL